MRDEGEENNGRRSELRSVARVSQLHICHRCTRSCGPPDRLPWEDCNRRARGWATMAGEGLLFCFCL